MGPGPRFELGRKAPQACMLPSYITPAAFPCFSCASAVFDAFRTCSFLREITNPLFSFAEDFPAIVVLYGDVFKSNL
jgi:hypothetical protein